MNWRWRWRLGAWTHSLRCTKVGIVAKHSHCATRHTALRRRSSVRLLRPLVAGPSWVSGCTQISIRRPRHPPSDQWSSVGAARSPDTRPLVRCVLLPGAGRALARASRGRRRRACPAPSGAHVRLPGYGVFGGSGGRRNRGACRGGVAAGAPQGCSRLTARQEAIYRGAGRGARRVGAGGGVRGGGAGVPAGRHVVYRASEPH